MPSRHRLELLGAPLDPVTLAEAVRLAELAVRERRPLQHGCVNAAKLVRLRRDPALRAALDDCDLVTADGQAVVWAARLLGVRLPERVAGIDLMEALLSRAEEAGFRVYLLGAREEALARAVEAIRRRHPRLSLVGARHGYFGPGEEDAVVAAIAAAEPDLLFVALDTPRKEIFLRRHAETLRVPFAMGVGGAFDVLAGVRRRAPRWAQRAGLEWAFRFAQEPRRLAGRYLVGNTRFALLVLRELRRSRAARAEGTVLFVGPVPPSRGGVASALAAVASRRVGSLRVELLPTFADGGRVTKLVALGRGLLRASRRFGAPEVTLVHLHASSYWSFRRKLLFHALARLRGKPVVWQIHCSRFPGYLAGARPLERRLIARALRSARAVVCIAGETRQALAAELGIEAAILRHGVESRPLPPSGRPLVLALARVCEEKGSFLLLRAFARVAPRMPDARLVLAGGGDLEAARREAERLGIADAVELPGWIDGEEKAHLLEEAALLAHPSFGEALPMAVVEALAAARPVVATRVGDVPEIVRDGVDGFLVDPGDEAGLAAALERVLADPALRRRMSRNAAGAASAFDPDAVSARLAEVYARV